MFHMVIRIFLFALLAIHFLMLHTKTLVVAIPEAMGWPIPCPTVLGEEQQQTFENMNAQSLFCYLRGNWLHYAFNMDNSYALLNNVLRTEDPFLYHLTQEKPDWFLPYCYITILITVFVKTYFVVTVVSTKLVRVVYPLVVLMATTWFGAIGFYLMQWFSSGTSPQDFDELKLYCSREKPLECFSWFGPLVLLLCAVTVPEVTRKRWNAKAYVAGERKR
eukprot:PhF_6_TR29210/c0_g1_i1/m.42736